MQSQLEADKTKSVCNSSNIAAHIHEINVVVKS
jgi:hypothetical protein